MFYKAVRNRYFATRAHFGKPGGQSSGLLKTFFVGFNFRITATQDDVASWRTADMKPRHLALGYTIGTIETYKTFFFPNKPRGKFSGMSIKFSEMLKRRNYFVPMYVAIWVAVITTIVVAFIQPHQGLI